MTAHAAGMAPGRVRPFTGGGGWALVVAWALACAPLPVAHAAEAPRAVGAVPAKTPVLPSPTATARIGADAQALVQWIQAQHDHQGLPFIVVDKREAQLHVHASDGTRLGSTPVLLGLARGDHTVPGIGQRPMHAIQPHERTTPAGRFVSEPGRNLQNEDIVWIDYEAAVSIHRLRTVDPAQRRAERIASPHAAQRRITYGCVNVPASFYDRYIAPVMGRQPAVVYVLPDQGAWTAVFGARPSAP